MALSITLIKVLEHPLVTAIAKAIQKFRRLKSYWGVISFVIAFTLREALAASYGEAIKAFTTAQAEGSDYAWLWNVLGFIFGEGGSWVLVSLGFLLFLVLSLVKISENKNNTITLKESFLSLILLLSIVGIAGYSLFNNNTQHGKIHTKLDKLTTLVNKLQNGDETVFLTKYFGKDYAVILDNPQTYHNFSTLLTQSNKTAYVLLKEREALLEKIASQHFSERLQQKIDKAFSELRYDDARALMDAFLEANSDTEQAIIKAHYIKALSYMEQIRYRDAKKEFEYIGPSVDDAEILSDYAFMYDTLGEYDKAITFYEKGLKITLATLGENHPDAASSYNNIGLAWHHKGKYDKAVIFYKKALRIRLTTLGESHPNTAISYNNIGGIWDIKGEYDKAISFYGKSLKIMLATLGENHPATATNYINIGSAWDSKGEYDKAINFFEKSLKIMLATLGENHPKTATSYNNIGLTWHHKGEYDKAINFFEKALKISLASLGEMHPATAASYNNVGLAWGNKGEHDKAISFYEKALKVLKVSFPTGHPYIDITEDSLRSAKEKLKK